MLWETNTATVLLVTALVVIAGAAIVYFVYGFLGSRPPRRGVSSVTLVQKGKTVRFNLKDDLEFYLFLNAVVEGSRTPMDVFDILEPIRLSSSDFEMLEAIMRKQGKL